MQVGPSQADQRHLGGEQHEPTDEGQGVEVDDQRIVEPVLADMVEAVGAEPGQDPDPDQGDEQKEGVAIRLRLGRKSAHRHRCHVAAPAAWSIRPARAEVGKCWRAHAKRVHTAGDNGFI